MRARSLSHLSRRALLSKLDEAEARDRSSTADVLAYLAEVDRRRLYVPDGYPSLFAWCVETRHYSEDVAAKRIRAARAVRRFPVILDMIADGRLHVSAVVLLSQRLTAHNAESLLAAAVHKSKRRIESMLAERFPAPDVPTLVHGLASASSLPAPGPVNSCAPAAAADLMSAMQLESAPQSAGASVEESVPGRIETSGPGAAPHALQPAPAPLAPPMPYPRVAPLAPERYSVQFTMDQAMYDDLCRARELLGRGVSGEIPEVLRRALRVLVVRLEKQKFAATSKPKTQAQATPSRGRHIPAAVRREVWKRDRGRCTFVSENGHRCESREAIEFDHIEPVARGGQSTAGNLRLRCRAHNQYEAEQAFGEGFMHEIRERARAAPVARSPGP